MYGFLGGSMVKRNAGDSGDMDSIPGLGRFPWRRAWQPTPLFICNLLLFLNIILRFIHVAGVAVIHSCFTVPKLGYPLFYLCIFNLSSVFVKINNYSEQLAIHSSRNFSTPGV